MVHDALADFGAQRRGGRFFEQLLVAALDAAFALAQDFDVAVLVGQDLEFDVARRGDVLFEIDVGAGEGRARFLLRLRKKAGEFGGFVDDAHAASAAARRAFRITG